MSLVKGTQQRKRYTLAAGVEQQITFEFVVDEKGNRVFPNTFVFRQFGGTHNVLVSPYSTEADTKPYKTIVPSGDGMIVEPVGSNNLYLYCSAAAVIEISSYWDDTPDVQGIGVGQNVTITNSTTTSSVTVVDGGIAAIGATTDATNTNSAVDTTLIGFTRGILSVINTVTGQIVAALALLTTIDVDTGNIDTKVAAGNALLTTIDADTGNIDTKIAAGNALLTTIDVDTGNIAVSTAGIQSAIVALPTTPTIYNVTLTTANTEYSQALPAGTQTFSVSIIDGLGSGNYRIAFETGKVATPTAPYLKYTDSMEYGQDNVNLTSKTLYIASNTAGQVAQIIAWA